MQTPKYKYKFSFVMPVYNVEHYLAETIESILAQTMDFEKNCELILVNDGSPDNSEKVCLRYQQQFPANIKYIEQENAGVSAARNRGIQEVEGKYISFLDSDDKISSDTLEEVYHFFEKHYSKIDFASIKMDFFDGRQGGHPLNYKYKQTRVVDIGKNYDFVQLSVGPVFAKTEAIKNRYEFDVRLKALEDAKLLSEVVLEKGAYGVVSKPTYYYRRRINVDSASTGYHDAKYWYFTIPELVYQYLIDYSLAKYTTVPRYVQFLIMYELQWRYRQQRESILEGDEKVTYRRVLERLLSSVDDDIIIQQRNLSLVQKIFVLRQKNKDKVERVVKRIGNYLYYRDRRIYDYEVQKPAIHLDFINIKSDKLILEGYSEEPFFGSKLQFKVGERFYDVQPVKRFNKKVLFLNQLVFEGNYFTIEIPIRDGIKVAPYFVTEQTAIPLRLISHHFTGLSQSVGRAYCLRDNYIVLKRPNYLELEHYSVPRHFIRELKYSIALLQNSRLYQLRYRMLYWLAKPFFQRRIWLISDRINSAGDNGYYLFSYLSNLKPKNITPYFVLDKNSIHYDKIRKMGKVVNYGSIQHKVLFLLAENNISSHFDDYIRNVFGTKETCLRDLYNFKFVYLEHGVMAQSIAEHIHKYKKNMKLITASSPLEKQAIIDDPRYGYDDSVVKLAGQARFDGLVSRPEKKVIFSPSWRLNIAGRIEIKNGMAMGRRLRSTKFKDSQYCTFYNSLINDKRILKALKDHGYSGEFYLHPNFSEHITDFDSNETVKVMSPPYDYERAFCSGNLMVTDYSGVAFDFAYMKKPVLYTQFDYDSFYQSHNYEQGYYSFEKHGFGPVLRDYEATVRELIAAIENDCVMPAKYQRRVDKFFYKIDRNNSRRIYGAIQALERD